MFGCLFEILFIIGIDPININSVLATFKLSRLLAINYFLRFSKSEFIAASTSFIDSPAAVRFASSANSRGFCFA
jgi:hypothetical protein